MEYDYLIVGSGLFGSVFAQQMTEAGKRVLVIEKRDHIGGNCYSEPFQDTKVLVHKYGTHIFHTSDERVWQYIHRFTEFNRYQHRVLTTHQNRVFAMPINLGTINAFYGIHLRPHEVRGFIESKREHIENPQNLEEKAISLIGVDLYEAFIKGYTQKQWGCDPRELPADIITRLPVRASYYDSYFDDLYQGIPSEGFTPIFERMLEGIPIETGVDFLDDREHWLRQAKQVVYTGPLDRYFNYEEGRLNWRSVRFEEERIERDDFQGTSVMNYADLDVPYTRIHEPKHLHRERTHAPGLTAVITEYPHVDPEAPYYPVNSSRDLEIRAKYEKRERNERRVIFGGRLAEYKYYDMDKVIGRALDCAQEQLS